MAPGKGRDYLTRSKGTLDWENIQPLPEFSCKNKTRLYNSRTLWWYEPKSKYQRRKRNQDPIEWKTVMKYTLRQMTGNPIVTTGKRIITTIGHCSRLVAQNQDKNNHDEENNDNNNDEEDNDNNGDESNAKCENNDKFIECSSYKNVDPDTHEKNVNNIPSSSTEDCFVLADERFCNDNNSGSDVGNDFVNNESVDKGEYVTVDKDEDERGKDNKQLSNRVTYFGQREKNVKKYFLSNLFRFYRRRRNYDRANAGGRVHDLANGNKNNNGKRRATKDKEDLAGRRRSRQQRTDRHISHRFSKKSPRRSKRINQIETNKNVQTKQKLEIQENLKNKPRISSNREIKKKQREKIKNTNSEESSCKTLTAESEGKHIKNSPRKYRQETENENESKYVKDESALKRDSKIKKEKRKAKREKWVETKQNKKIDVFLDVNKRSKKCGNKREKNISKSEASQKQLGLERSDENWPQLGITLNNEAQTLERKLWADVVKGPDKNLRSSKEDCLGLEFNWKDLERDKLNKSTISTNTDKTQTSLFDCDKLEANISISSSSSSSLSLSLTISPKKSGKRKKGNKTESGKSKAENGKIARGMLFDARRVKHKHGQDETQKSSNLVKSKIDTNPQLKQRMPTINIDNEKLLKSKFEGDDKSKQGLSAGIDNEKLAKGDFGQKIYIDNFSLMHTCPVSSVLSLRDSSNKRAGSNSNTCNNRIAVNSKLDHLLGRETDTEKPRSQAASKESSSSDLCAKLSHMSVKDDSLKPKRRRNRVDHSQDNHTQRYKKERGYQISGHDTKKSNYQSEKSEKHSNRDERYIAHDRYRKEKPLTHDQHKTQSKRKRSHPVRMISSKTDTEDPSPKTKQKKISAKYRSLIRRELSGSHICAKTFTERQTKIRRQDIMEDEKRELKTSQMKLRKEHSLASRTGMSTHPVQCKERKQKDQSRDGEEPGCSHWQDAQDGGNSGGHNSVFIDNACLVKSFVEFLSKNFHNTQKL